jgi:hypothetical protein
MAMKMNSEAKKIYLKNYYLKNKERMNLQTSKRRKDNKDKYLQYQYSYVKARNKKDPHFRLLNNMRKKVCNVLRAKNDKTLAILGCSSKDLKEHMESQFKPGMSWDNYGFRGWHVDHIIPLASASSTAELKSLCHYTNLQPLWMQENLSKSNKMPYPKAILTK